MINNDKIIVYTDGSCLNNGSPRSGCGWACKLMYNGYEKLKSGGCRNYRIGKNVELWNELMAIYKQFSDITPVWVKGHNGNQHNEHVDRLAVEESKKWQ